MSVRLFCVSGVDLSVLSKELNRPAVCSCSTGWRTRELKTEVSFNVSNESWSSDVIVLVERKTRKAICCPLPYLLKISWKKSKVLACTRLQPDRRRSDRRRSASWKILYHLKSCFQSYRIICSAIVCIKDTHCHHEGRIAVISLIGINDCKWWLVAEDILSRCWDSIHAEDIDKLIDEECKQRQKEEEGDKDGTGTSLSDVAIHGPEAVEGERGKWVGSRWEHDDNDF